ncbi:MAG TPA: RluA family pseudouridine synthase [Erysipelotrichaceae bacterium]|nr:RluA family pseudouridine synthase [Erysipelotrichaceae bacterium]HQA85800.1 RluA family pseudouridine synthase [Erysipelotrichaceae bacterium]
MKRVIEKSINLNDCLKQLMFSKKDIHLLKMEKRLKVNDDIVISDIVLHKNDVLEIDVIKDEEIDKTPIVQDIKILYEDDFVLVVDKPIGIIIHDDGNKDTLTLDNLISGYYQSTSQKHRILHVHRLDKETSGCILYCKQSYLIAYFDYCIANNLINRNYLALVAGIIDKEMIINKKIGKDRHINNKYRISNSGKDATTIIKPIKQQKDTTLIECSLKTGRTHQIRVHLQAIGHPIIGDTIYCGKKHDRLMLHSYKLSFVHPITNEQITVESDLN